MLLDNKGTAREKSVQGLEEKGPRQGPRTLADLTQQETRDQEQVIHPSVQRLHHLLTDATLKPPEFLQLLFAISKYLNTILLNCAYGPPMTGHTDYPCLISVQYSLLKSI